MKQTNAMPTSDVHLVDDMHPDEEGVEYTEVADAEALSDVTAARETDKSISVEEDEEVPEEMRGKTTAQLAKMYKEAQSVIGRQGSELGDLRKTADLAIRLGASRAAQPQRAALAPREPAKPLDDVDFFTDPKAAVRAMIAADPELQKLRGGAQQTAAREIARGRETNQAKFDALHPDAGEILGNTEFREWVGRSKIRQALLHRAHTAFDVDAADEVLATWKALHPKAAEGAVAPTPAAKAAAAAKAKAGKSAASVPSGGNATHKETSGSGGKPIFRRAQVLQMMEKEPKRYEAMSDEITLAYAEGRVR